MKLKKVREGAKVPTYGTAGAAAADLYAATEAPITIEPGGRAMIPIGIAIASGRDDIVALIYGRSGLGAKHGVTLANCVGVIDSDYRGEISVPLINHGGEPYTVMPGERVAQMAFTPVMHAAFEECGELDETQRGTSGFGSTGKE